MHTVPCPEFAQSLLLKQWQVPSEQLSEIGGLSAPPPAPAKPKLPPVEKGSPFGPPPAPSCGRLTAGQLTSPLHSTQACHFRLQRFEPQCSLLVHSTQAERSRHFVSVPVQ